MPDRNERNDRGRGNFASGGSSRNRSDRDFETDIDYRWEGNRGSFDDDEYDDPTDRGYDEAVRSGSSRYGFVEGRGGVFGTSGGGNYNGGFQVVERPGIYDRDGEESFGESSDERNTRGRGSDRFDEVMFYDRGPHAGKGPKSYKRSDERIREDVNERLTRHGAIDASDIDVTCENGEVTLSGQVDSRREKRLAEGIAETVFGVIDVHNRLKPRQGMFSKILGR